ncbi:hypothetical protein DM586_03155 [Vibrio fluvialis]|nr:hypothetical protein DM586_03155 [Vibrio fluvialis]
MTTDRIVSISSMVIALAALCVSMWQGFVVQKHNKLSLKPYITSAPRLPGVGGENGIFISNDGLGPAFIKEAKIIVNGESFDLTSNSWPAVYAHLGLKKLCYSESWFKKGSSLKPGEFVKILAPTKMPIDSSCPIEFIKLLSASELELSLVYESIYEEEYTYISRIGLDPQEIALYKKVLKF